MARQNERSALVKLAHWLANHHAIYEIIQRLAGRRTVTRWLGVLIGESDGGLVLDVGSSGGEHALHYVRSTVSLDVDLTPLVAAKHTRRDSLFVCASATALPFKARSVNLVLCIAVSHHLDDRSLDLALSELGRVASDRVIFMDAVRSRSPISRLMWALDRGSHPRTEDHLQQAIRSALAVQKADSLRVLHKYRLWICNSRVME